MCAASLNINASTVLPGLPRAGDIGFLVLLSRGRDPACWAEGPRVVCPPGQLWALRADSAAGPGSEATETFATTPIVLRLQEKAQLGAEL